MTRNPEFGNVTGTKDKDYDIIWFTEVCLSNVLRLETYIEDAARGWASGSSRCCRNSRLLVSGRRA
jgi:hypothetical protein